MKTFMILICIFSSSHLAFGKDPNANSAITNTQDDMRDPNKRKQMLDTKAAQDADKAAASLAGDEKNKNEMYNISADLVGIIGEQSDGDPAKMQKLLEEAQKDPEGFFNNLPAAQRQRIQGLAKDIEKNGGPAKKTNP